MARPNYSYEKRQKELAKQKKNEEKRLRRLEKRKNSEDGVSVEIDIDSTVEESGDGSSDGGGD